MVEERSNRLLERDDQFVGGRCFHSVYRFEQALAGIDRIGAASAVEAEFGGGRGKRRAVMESHALAQGEGVGFSIRRHVHLFGQRGVLIAVGADQHQPFEDVGVHDFADSACDMA